MRQALILFLVVFLALPALPAWARLAGPPEPWQQPVSVRDLAEIRRSGELRVLVNQSRNASGELGEQTIGVELHRLHAFEQFLNRDARGGQHVRLKIVPLAKDQLLLALQRGQGDLVAPGERVEVAQARGIAASEPTLHNVPLRLISRQGGARYSRLEQLSGRAVALPAGSAAGAPLQALNRQLIAAGKAPVAIEWVDPSLAVEDVLEMVQAGIYPLTVAEAPIAERWSKVMPRLRIDRQPSLAADGDMSWFTRSDAPMLRASVDAFLRSYRAPDDQDAAFARAYRRLYRVQDPLTRDERKRLEKVRSVLQRYGEAQQFDWLSLAALAFKESTLNPAARGSGGAMGLLQITPDAARSVGVSDIRSIDNNVQAATRYLARLRDRFFASPRLNERERLAFVLAAYNLGPQRVQSLRAEAKRRGLNPNQWFFQVERVAAEQVGLGVVGHVNAVNKYYLAYARQRYLLEPQASLNVRR